MSKILIVEDDEDIGAVLQKELKKDGYEVLRAATGTEGRMMLGTNPDLILMDLMLPGMSGEELLTIAEEDTKKKETHFRDLVFGLLDLSIVLFFFLPFFGQEVNRSIQEVSLISLTETAPWLRTTYFAVALAIIGFGILTFALQTCNQVFWVKHKSYLSLAANAVGVFLFIVSSQPYAAAFVFLFLAIKVIMLIKKP